MRRVMWVVFVVLALGTAARAEQEVFVARDSVPPAETYLESDGGVVSDEPEESPWDTFVEGEAPPADRFELPGIWAIKQTSPELQTLVAGPTFRNQKYRTEVGAGFAYINSKYRFPFELSIEPTWRRNKNVPAGEERDFARLRTFGLVEVWNRSSNWESTAVALTGFYGTQTNTFNTLEVGGSVSETIGRRLSLSANAVWGGDWFHGAPFVDGAIASFGASYNVGAGARFGGFYEPVNDLANEDDWGGFVSYQFLPFAEFIVNAGKHEFVLVRLLISYALERP